MATMQGGDVSNWKDIDVTKFRDFVIIQTTWGTGGFNNTNLRNGVSTIADKQYQAAKRAGKKLGIMHYAMNRGAAAEAKFFKANNVGYFGEALPTLDWEAQDNSAVNDPAAFEQYLIEFEKVQGGPGIAYFQKSLYAKLKPICDRHNWGAWVAQYATTAPTGVQESPWNETYPCAIRQYTSAGEIGVGAAVDLDKFYGDSAAWDRYVKAAYGKASAPVAPNASIPAVQGPNWVAENATYTMQTAVNIRSGISTNDSVIATLKAGDVIRTDAAIIANGYRWVRQPRGNGYGYIATGPASNTLQYVRQTISGAERVYRVNQRDNLSSIAARLNTTVAALLAVNHIPNPDLIHPGDKIKY